MPDGEKRKKRNDSVKKYDRGQQLSDARARDVSKGRMTYEQARKSDSIADSKVRVSKIGKKVRSSSENVPSKRKYKKVTGYKLDRHGKKVAY